MWVDVNTSCNAFLTFCQLFKLKLVLPFYLHIKTLISFLSDKTRQQVTLFNWMLDYASFKCLNPRTNPNINHCITFKILQLSIKLSNLQAADANMMKFKTPQVLLHVACFITHLRGTFNIQCNPYSIITSYHYEYAGADPGFFKRGGTHI